MRTFFICTALFSAACVACNSPSPRLNAPPHGVAQSTSELRDTYVYMTDNALLADMSISDVHFVPHRPMLNTLGQERLSRLAALLDAYGGGMRFSTKLKDSKLVQERTDAVVAFLGGAGIDTSVHEVRLDLPGGDGLDAQQVILIRANEGTYRPGGSGSGSRAAQATTGQPAGATGGTGTTGGAGTTGK
jgi:hypothetical protein